MNLDRPLAPEEVAEYLGEACLFAGDHVGTCVAQHEPEPGPPGSVVLTLARWHRFQTGRPQRFRITVQPIPEEDPDVA